MKNLIIRVSILFILIFKICFSHAQGTKSIILNLKIDSRNIQNTDIDKLYYSINNVIDSTEISNSGYGGLEVSDTLDSIIFLIKKGTKTLLNKAVNLDSSQTEVFALNILPEIYHENDIALTAQVSPNSQIGYGVIIRDSVTIDSGVVVGDFVEINKNSHIHKNSTIESFVTIHENVHIFSNTSIGKYTKIGNNSIINNNSNIHEGNIIMANSLIGNNTTIGQNSITGAFTTINQNSNIGYNSIIGSNVTLNENCIVGSGVYIKDSVVINQFKHIPDLTVVNTNNQSFLMSSSNMMVGLDHFILNPDSTNYYSTANYSLFSNLSPNLLLVNGELQFKTISDSYKVFFLHNDTIIRTNSISFDMIGAIDHGIITYYTNGNLHKEYFFYKSSTNARLNNSAQIPFFSNNKSIETKFDFHGVKESETSNALNFESKLIISPNPFKNNINFYNTIFAYSYKLIDIKTRMLLEDKLEEGNNEIDLSYLKEGMYLLNIFSIDGKLMESHKLIKN